jgi:LysM repeat protein
LVLIPAIARAGFFQAISRVFSPTSAKAQIESANTKDNSQTMSLLEAPVKSGKEAPDILFSPDGAVANESGPSGMISDLFDERSEESKISTYVVQPGDTVSGIATKFGVSVNTILWSNDIKKAALVKPGMELVVLRVTGVKHKVQKGDTLQSIANKYNGEISDIEDYNGIDSNNKLVVGDTVIIPGGEIKAAPQKATPAKKIVDKVQTTVGNIANTVSGYFTRPATGARVRGISSGHKGVDIDGVTGDPIYAAADGTVAVSRSSGYNGGFGLYVAVNHDNGTQTLYAHMSKVHVSAGESVKKGQVIGLIGNTGRSEGDHLHFEVHGAANPF